LSDATLATNRLILVPMQIKFWMREFLAEVLPLPDSRVSCKNAGSATFGGGLPSTDCFKLALML